MSRMLSFLSRKRWRGIAGGGRSPAISVPRWVSGRSLEPALAMGQIVVLLQLCSLSVVVTFVQPPQHGNQSFQHSPHSPKDTTLSAPDSTPQDPLLVGCSVTCTLEGGLLCLQRLQTSSSLPGQSSRLACY